MRGADLLGPASVDRNRVFRTPSVYAHCGSAPKQARPRARRMATLANVGQNRRGRDLGIASPAPPGLVGSELYGSLSDADSFDQIGYG